MKSPIESLESRVCLSSPAGGAEPLVRAEVNLQVHAARHLRPADQGTGQTSVAGGNFQRQPERRADGFLAGGRRTWAASREFGSRDFSFDFRPVMRQRSVVAIFITFPTTGGTPQPPAVEQPPPAVAAPPQAAPVAVAPPPHAPAKAEPATGAVVAVETQPVESNFVVPPADATSDVAAATEFSSPVELLAAAAEAIRSDGSAPPTSASAGDAVDFAVAGVGSLVERWTSPWHAPAAGQVGDLVTVDVATHLVMPLAETVAGMVAPSVAASYEIAHLGSPFALLADSLATFVEESAAVSNVAAQAQSRGPWALTFGVLAADLFILSYVYRRKSTARRAGRVQLAPPGLA